MPDYAEPLYALITLSGNGAIEIEGYCCGIDLHARSMYVCIMDRTGKIKFHRNLKNDFALLTQALKPYRRN